MKIVDARSGMQIMVSGSAPTMWATDPPSMKYDDGSGWVMLAVEPGLLRARAKLRSTYQDGNGRWVTQEHWQPLIVRWTHPGFFLQHVAFLPS